ncbi:MAG: hypothetical protein ACJ760_13375 [Thermoleophilaceae bacterium]
MPSTWTRKVAAPIAAVATMGLFALGAAPASADASLSVKSARHLAQKLADKQERERSLKFTHVGGAHRVSSNRIDFPYRDRSSKDVLCTATIVVEESNDKRSADLSDVSCDGIPSEILAYERVTRKMRHRVKDMGYELRKSDRDYAKSLEKCDDLVVPAKRKDEVALLFDVGGTRAFYMPIRSILDKFNVALHDVHGEDPRMTRGVDAWDRTLVLIGQLPPATKNPCKAVQKWADNDYSSDSAPADFDQLKVIRQQFKAQEKVENEASRHFAEAGAFPAIAKAFAPRGLRSLVF